VGDAAKLGADGVGGETGPKQAAVNSGDLALAERASEMSKAALQAGADEFGFGSIGEHGLKGGVDVTIGHAAGTQLASDTETSLAASVGALAGKFKRVAGVIEIVVLAEPGDDLRDGVFVFRAALEIGTHFVDGMGAAHERAKSGGVQILLR